MATPHEILFQLNAIQGNSFPKTFVEATQKINELQVKMQKLNATDTSGMDKANQKVATAKSSVDYLSSSYDKAHRKTLELKRAYTQNTQSCTEMARAISQCGAPTKNMINDFNKATKESGKLKQSWQDSRTESHKLKEQLSQQSKTLHQATTEIEKLEKAERSLAKVQGLKSFAQSIKTSVEEVINNLAKARAQLMTIGSAFSPYKHMIDKSLEIEMMGAQIRKNIHYHDENEYQQHMKKLLSIGQNYAVSQEQLLHMAELGATSTIKKEEMYDTVLDGVKTSQALKTSFEEGMQIGINFRVGLGKTREEANELVDTLVVLGENSMKTADWISTFANSAGAQTDQAGLKLKALMAIGSALSEEQASKASTSIIAVTQVLTKGAEHLSKAQAEIFSKAHLNVKDLQLSMQNDAPGTILSVAEAFKKYIPISEQAAATSVAFGQTAAPVFSQIMQKPDLIKKQLALVADSSKYKGRAGKEADIVNQATINKIQMMQNAMDSLKQSMGDTLLPILAELATKAKEFFETLQPIIENHKELVKWVLLAGAGFTAIIAIITSLGFAFIGIKGLVDTIKLIAKAQKLWNIAAWANPTVLIVGAIIVAVGLLAYGIYELVQNWDAVYAAVQRFGIYLKDKFMAIVQPVLDIGEKIAKTFGWLSDSGDKNINVNMKNETLDNEIKAFQAKQKAPQQNVMHYTFSPNIAGIDNPQAIQQTLQQYGQKGSKQGFDLFDNQMRMAN